MDNTRDRIFFLNGLMDMFKELILDLHGFADSGTSGDRKFCCHIPYIVNLVFGFYLTGRIWRHVTTENTLYLTNNKKKLMQTVLV